MTKKNSETMEDYGLEKAQQIYSQLNEAVKLWQEERGLFWKDKLPPAAAPPFYNFADFPTDLVLEVWERLNQIRSGSVSQAELIETWEAFKNGQTVGELELLTCLQIALRGIAGICRVRVEEDNLLDPTSMSERASCPVCGEEAAFSILSPPNGKRFLHCILCGHQWPTIRTACIRCGSQNPDEQNYLGTQDYPGVEVVLCDSCGQYFKEFDLRLLSVTDYIWEDVKTLPLNYAAEQWLADQAKETGKTQ